MRLKTKLVAIAKNEAAYLPQWIYHHFWVGFNEIEIHINDTDDNSITICEKIKKNNPNLVYHLSDRLRADSISQNRSFQISAYNHSLHDSKNCTHLMTLDLDEFLIPRNMRNTLKDLLTRQTTPYCLSFLWYSDNFIPTEAFSSPIKAENTIYRMDHVKTISKLSKKIHSCSHHNFIYNKENKIINLLGGTIIRLDDSINTQSTRSKLSKQQLNSLSVDKAEPWFVLHCIYKSETEYLASLCRGRGHNNDERPLKVNRWGMSPYPFYNGGPIHWSPGHNQARRYQSGLDQFIKENDLKEELIHARNDILKTTKKLDELLTISPHLKEEYQKIFTGTKHTYD